MKTLQILLADDHDFVRRGLQATIEQQPDWKVCATAGSGDDALRLIGKHQPDIAVIDLNMPGIAGLDLIRKIKETTPACEILVFTGEDSDQLIREVYREGAKAFILKTEVASHLLLALQSLAEKRPYFTDKGSEVIFSRFINSKNEMDGSEERLTIKEQHLLRLLADGLSNEKASKKLRVSARTVEDLRAGIMRKLKITSFADLVRYAVRNKIVAA